ncbi:MAG: vitamin B12-dependent ribonucleotide reductase [Gemmatimonadota bacterium]|nr:MAG: vitamin B12-dependent ribonucleotide reductase [Gemmatimonadota bacterium]
MAVATGIQLSLSENATKVLERRYLRKDERGELIETPEEMFRRVAKNIASAERKYNPNADVLRVEEEFYRTMSDLEFMPNSPTLMNAGTPLQMLSACFVLPVEDSMERIFDSVKHAALVNKAGGGTGFSFSRIRPKNDIVQSTKGVASGPVSFMHVFDAATETIKQGGRRRGANMGILRIDHPDILDFIRAKKNPNVLNTFNLSVGLTEAFMEAVQKNSEYDLLHPNTKEPVGRLKAKEVFDLITDLAWRNGDPGIIFLDRINKDNPTPKLGEIESTNPCGEQPLLPYESCNLGSINLAKMITATGGQPSIDYPRLARTVRTAVRFLDNVIDMNRYPLQEIEERTFGNRKIGLGIMGFADMLIWLGVPYNSKAALETAEEVMRFVSDKAKEASQELAEERGPFPNFAGSTYDVSGLKKTRNATLTTIAPTGSISIISNCSSGIEPLFAISYVRNVMDNTKLLEVHSLFKEVARRKGFFSQELMEKIASKGTIQHLDEIPLKVRKLFVTAHDISPEWHIRIQSAFQKYTDNAVSKTVNFPTEATVENVAEVYMLAFDLGCKGVTIYRDRSRDVQVLNIDSSEPEMADERPPDEITRPRKALTPRKRPTVTVGTTQRVTTGCGNLYVTINEDEKGLCELFSRLGKSGGCIASHTEAISRLVSLALRSGVDVESILSQIKGIRCPSPSWYNGGSVLSCADGIGLSLEEYLKEKKKSTGSAKKIGSDLRDICPECPDCGSLVEYMEGCVVCRACGYSKCD